MEYSIIESKVKPTWARRVGKNTRAQLKVNRNKWIQYSFQWFFDIRFNLPVCVRRVCVFLYTWFCVHFDTHIEQIDVTKMLFRQNEIGNFFLMPFLSHSTTQKFTCRCYCCFVHSSKNVISATKMISQFILSLGKNKLFVIYYWKQQTKRRKLHVPKLGYVAK